MAKPHPAPTAVFRLACGGEAHTVLLTATGRLVFCDHPGRQIDAEVVAAKLTDGRGRSADLDCGRLAALWRDSALDEHSYAHSPTNVSLEALDTYNMARLYRMLLTEGRRTWRRLLARTPPRAAPEPVAMPAGQHPTPDRPALMCDPAYTPTALNAAGDAVAAELRRRGFRVNTAPAGKKQQWFAVRPAPNPDRWQLRLSAEVPYSYHSRSLRHPPDCRRVYAVHAGNNETGGRLLAPPPYFHAGGRPGLFDVAAAADLFAWMQLSGGEMRRSAWRAEAALNRRYAELLLPAWVRRELEKAGVHAECAARVLANRRPDRPPVLTARTTVGFTDRAPGVIRYALSKLAQALHAARRQSCLAAELDPEALRRPPRPPRRRGTRGPSE